MLNIRMSFGHEIVYGCANQTTLFKIASEISLNMIALRIIFKSSEHYTIEASLFNMKVFKWFFFKMVKNEAHIQILRINTMC